MTTVAGLRHADVERAVELLRVDESAGVRAIAGALEAWVQGVARSFDEAHRKVVTQLAYTRRDALVRELAGRWYGGSPSDRQRGVEIEALLRRYRGGADWRRDRTREEISYRDTPRGYCWEILKAVDVPLGGRQIRRILAGPWLGGSEGPRIVRRAESSEKARGDPT